MPEKAVAHVGLNPYADDMAPILDKVIQPAFQAVNQKHGRAGENQQPQIAVRDVVVDNILGDDRIKQVADGDGKGADQVEREQFQVRFVVRNKFSIMKSQTEWIEIVCGSVKFI